MREWLSWWSTTLPRSGSRVRVPSRALHKSEYHLYARVAQLVEHDLAKVGVAGSSPVSRSSQKVNIIFIMREWLSWWSTTLPRSGSRVRVPSRALLNIERGYPLGYPLSILNESYRTRTGSYLRFASVGAKPTSTGRCAPRLAPAFFLPDSNIRGLHSVPVGALLPMHRM